MSGRLLLDTNIVIALFGGEPAVQEHLGQADDAIAVAICHIHSAKLTAILREEA